MPSARIPGQRGLAEVESAAQVPPSPRETLGQDTEASVPPRRCLHRQPQVSDEKRVNSQLTPDC
ncbi:MAG TPA: hypothetical protein VMY42_01775, partial [Thermoguttaceae bacterium]|nr:hypothetical protein [Thermoguttaceae bacterium]